MRMRRDERIGSRFVTARTGKLVGRFAFQDLEDVARIGSGTDRWRLLLAWRRRGARLCGDLRRGSRRRGLASASGSGAGLGAGGVGDPPQPASTATAIEQAMSRARAHLCNLLTSGPHETQSKRPNPPAAL